MTIKDIAKLSGVSISTVSKIVNNKDKGINEETRKRVLKIVKEYNYTPYANVKSINNTKTFIIGVILKENSKPNLFLNGLISIAQKKGYSIMIYTSSMQYDIELKNITSLIKNNVDGVIWETISEDSIKHKNLFEENNIKIIYVNNLNIKDAYSLDFLNLGYISGQKLIDYGHKDIACLIRQNSLRSDYFLEGFKKSLFDNGLNFNLDMALDIDSSILKSKILSRDITAVISAHEQLGVNLIEYLNKINYQIPRDISIITLWDDATKRAEIPKYAGIKLPYFEFGEFVCKKIIDKCEKSEKNNDIHTNNIFPFEYKIENISNISGPFSKSKKQIIVVGSINVDTTLTIDELPQLGNTVITNEVIITPGGKGANEAIGVSKLAYPVSMIGKVGDDYDASIVYSYMQENKINIKSIKRISDLPTGRAYIHLRNDGESLITVSLGANNQLNSNDILEFENLFTNINFCLMQTEVPIDALLKAAQLSHKYGAKNMLKPATQTKINYKLMKKIDFFIPNLSEATTLCNKKLSIPKMAEYFCSLGPETTIITLAEKGVYICSPDFCGYIPAVNFIPVDTTGGADAFISALAVYLSKNYPIQKAARIANYASAFCITKQGTIPALIDKNTLENYIKINEKNLLEY